MVGSGRNERRLLKYGVHLPHAMSYADSVHSARARVQDWTQQNVHFLCNGNFAWVNPVSGSINIRDVHFMLEKPVCKTALDMCTDVTQRCRTGFGKFCHMHLNLLMLTSYHYLCTNSVRSLHMSTFLYGIGMYFYYCAFFSIRFQDLAEPRF